MKDLLTYVLDRKNGPLYELLYRAILQDIASGSLAPGQKLPSKRTLADHLKISKMTVENAYAQLAAEGYIYSREKVGYFVEKNIEALCAAPPPVPAAPPAPESPRWDADLTSNSLPADGFPFSVWSKLMREVMQDYGDELLKPVPNCGAPLLREAICQYLHDFRSMSVSPEQILVGAGTDFLYNILIQLLGRDRVYALEDPGYSKIRQVYTVAGVHSRPVPLDNDGVMPEFLSGAHVLHLSPSHHFPTGIVTPIARRQALIAWAREAEGRYIIEDDYDSEFRLSGRPIPTMQSIDPAGKVIYLNSFTKSIAPSIRISYMVLPPALMKRFQEKLGFYACTVPSFEQYTLARFLSRGYFEKHLARMKKYYKGQRDNIISALEAAPFRSRMEILEQDAGLHFLLRVDTNRSDRELKALCEKAGIHIACLSDYDLTPRQEESHCLVVNYSGFDSKKAPELLRRLENILNNP